MAQFGQGVLMDPEVMSHYRTTQSLPGGVTLLDEDPYGWTGRPDPPRANRMGLVGV